MRRRLVRSIAVAFVAALVVLASQVAAFADAGPHGPATATGTGGAAATVDILATQAAVDTLLRAGGNAVDAAVTAAAVLGVTEPFSSGIGGGGFMVVYRATDERATTIDGRERAPAAMRPDSGRRQPAALRRRALQRPLRGCARHGGELGRGAVAVRNDLACRRRCSRRSASPATAS
jgi:Gamma-glutamyltranspeptidase